MDKSQQHRNTVRQVRALRVRKRLRGSASKPRMTVFKSCKHLYVQLIDDEAGNTLASASTLSKEYQKETVGRKNSQSASQLGLRIAELAKQKNVTTVVFDRGRYKYHGILKLLAEGAREGGLIF